MNNSNYRFWFLLKTLLTGILVFGLNQTDLFAQSLKYEANINGQKVGEMIAVKEVNDEAERILVKGFYEFNIDSLIKFEFESKSVYMDGVLKRSEASSWFDGGQKRTLTTHRYEESYAIERSWHHVIDPMLETALYGTDLFYFEEPRRIKKVYDIYTSNQMDIEKNGEDTYTLYFYDTQHLFQYNGGLLNSFTNSFGPYTITFKLIQ